MSPKLPRVDFRQLIRALKRAGFEEQRRRGSHLHLRRASDGKRVTVPVHKEAEYVYQVDLPHTRKHIRGCFAI